LKAGACLFPLFALGALRNVGPAPAFNSRGRGRAR
jgi:hypothetical protein